MKTNTEIKSILITAIRANQQTVLQQVLHAMCQNSYMHKVTIFDNWNDADHVVESYHVELSEDGIAELDELIESAKHNAFDARYSFPALLRR